MADQLDFWFAPYKCPVQGCKGIVRFHYLSVCEHEEDSGFWAWCLKGHNLKLDRENVPVEILEFLESEAISEEAITTSDP